MVTVVGACADYAGEVTPPGESAEGPAEVVTTTTLAPEPVPARALGVGDCADDPDDRFTAGGIVLARSCAEPHDLEVIAIVELGGPDAPWPGGPLVAEAADGACLAAFESVVGEPWAASSLDYVVLTPGPTDWEDGDRVARCAALTLSGAPLGAPLG